MAQPSLVLVTGSTGRIGQAVVRELFELFETRGTVHVVLAYLVEHEGVSPHHILAVTFTNKAAREMRERVEGLLGLAGHGLTIGTFHWTCARMLRRDGITLCIVEHNMDLVMRVADHILVIDYGQYLFEGTPAEVQAHEGVIAAYLGEAGR